MTGEKFTLKGHSFHKVLLLIKAKQKSKKIFGLNQLHLSFKLKNEIKFFLFSTFTFAQWEMKYTVKVSSMEPNNSMFVPDFKINN